VSNVYVLDACALIAVLTKYKIFLADSVGLAKAKASGGYFVTADHHEMDILEERENASIIWIRDKK